MKRLAAIIIMCLYAATAIAVKSPIDAINDFAQNPSSILKNYTGHPEEEKLWGKDIEARGHDGAPNSSAYQESSKAYLNNGVIIPESVLADSKFVHDNAEDILSGKSNKYLDCSASSRCKTILSDDKIECFEPPNMPDLVCTTDSEHERCQDLDKIVNAGFCHYEKTRCIAANGKKCIKYEHLYNCIKNRGQCYALRMQGCEETGETSCAEKNSDGLCLNFRKLYRCPINKCDIGNKIECADVDLCKDGKCPKPPVQDPSDKVTNSKSMATSMERLATINEISQNMPQDTSSQSAVLFLGRAMRCNYYPLDAKDCCKDSGWLGGMLHCNHKEIELGKAKEAGRVLTPRDETYCDQRARWPRNTCLKWKKSYCVYQSRMAKTILQAAITQLGKNLGDGRSPKCRGLTPEEFASLDFDKIDLGFLDEEIERKFKIKEKEVLERAGNNDASQMQETNTRSHTKSNGGN